MTSWLPDHYGMISFLFIHIPLFVILIALIASANYQIRSRSRNGISIFLVIHGFLHAMFMGPAGYEFESVSSNILIFGGMVLGVIYLIIEFSEKYYVRR